MKPIKLLIILFLLPCWLLSQETPLNKLYDRYHDRRGFNAEEVLPGSIEFDWEKDLASDDFQALKNSVRSIRFLSLKEDGKVSREKYWSRLLAAVAEEDYTEFVTMKGERASMMMYFLKGDGGNIREFAMLYREDERVVMVTATGDMNMSKVFGPEAHRMWKGIGWHLGKDRMCRKAD